MRKTCKLIYLILASRLIIFKIIETKYLLKYLLRHLHYLLINRKLINCKLNLFNNNKLYKKFSNINIKEINIFINKINDKLIKNYYLLNCKACLVALDLLRNSVLSIRSLTKTCAN